MHLEDEARHEVRKDARKLRYAVDFFSPLSAGDREKRLGGHGDSSAETLFWSIGQADKAR